MKRVFFLISLVLVFVLAGCNNNDQYAIERRYWQAQKQAEKIFKNPVATPNQQLINEVNTLNKFIKTYPQSNLAVDADLLIAKLYIVKEEYEAARQQLNLMHGKYAKYPDVAAEAIFYKGISYEKQDKWGEALNQYKKLMAEYPIALRGLDMPVYIAEHYRTAHQPDKMIAAYQEAAGHYRQLGEKYVDSPAGYNSYSLLVQCYLKIQDWQNALDALNLVLEKYKGKVVLDGALMEKALIYYEGIKDNQKTKAVLEQLKQEYPKSKLSAAADSLLKEISRK
ncbi:MAG: tetratricopeptide repeat protein [Candidatus Omnitrophica bacterium]|nr:tetratricopeptide repeat protein [Candidatus Omnitrophota bacterium]